MYSFSFLMQKLLEKDEGYKKIPQSVTTHSTNVSMLAEKLCKALDLDSKYTSEVTLGAMLHDIGKIAIPDRILFKEGKLTLKEKEIVDKHAECGYRYLEGYSDIVKNIAYGHHWRMDFNGYPKQEKDKKIPTECQIVAICDVYEALTSYRPYKEALSEKKALEIMQNDIGHFNEEYLECFREMIFEEIVNRTRKGLQVNDG